MKQLFTTLLLFLCWNLFCQNDIVITHYYFKDDGSTKKQKLKTTFDKDVNVIEELWFGRLHNPDTTAIGFSRKLKYVNSKLSEITHYQGGYNESTVSFTYSKNLVSTSQYKKDNDVHITTYFYDNNGNIKSKITTNGIDTSRVISYTYKNNKLSEMFSFDNEVENEKTIYAKSSDTIIETLIRHDSTHIEKPWIYITKRKIKDGKLVYRSEVIEEDKLKKESFASYDLSGNIIELIVNSVKRGIKKKEQYRFTYINGLIHKVHVCEKVNDISETKRFIVYEMQTNVAMKNKIKKKINNYFTKQIMQDY